MENYRGFGGEVSELGIVNAQGNYDQGRGADGLGCGIDPDADLAFVRTRTSRYGISVPISNRPPAISGKPTPPPSLDPNVLLPRVYGAADYTSAGRAEQLKRFPSQAPVIGATYKGRTDYTREELLKMFPPYSGPMATTSPVTVQPTWRTWSPTGAADVPGMPTGGAGRGWPTGTPIISPGLIDPSKIIETVTINKTIRPPVTLVRKVPVRRKKISKAKTIRHRQQFIGWMKNWAPGLYRRAAAAADAAEAREGGALGDLAGWWETFQENLTEIGGAYLQYKTQKEILEAQLERMRAGQPPLQTSEYAPTVGVKIDPGTTREITGAIGAGLGRMLPFIAIGGVALLLLMRRK